LGYTRTSADRYLYSDKDLSKSYPSSLYSAVAYSVRASNDSIYSGRLSVNDNNNNRSSDDRVLSPRTSRVSAELLEEKTCGRTSRQADSSEADSELSDVSCPGVVGIKNHGNTCFASSVVQCLSNTESFTEYFVNDRHRSHLVAAEKSGRECAVTDRLAQLIESLWTRAYTSKMSRSLLRTVWHNTELFADSSGHDAEEFLLWLLNTVNDELYGSSRQYSERQVTCVLIF